MFGAHQPGQTSGLRHGVAPAAVISTSTSVVPNANSCLQAKFARQSGQE
jgi:hypothetical protein